MRSKIASLTILGALLIAGAASGQGLLALQNRADLRESQPLTYSVGVSGGYDWLDYDADELSLEDINSFFIQSGVGVMYGDADRQTPWNIGADFGIIHYLDDAPRYDDTYYSARLAFNIVHHASRRLKISNNFYLAYEVEPDYAIGASTSLRNGQYLYGYDNFSVSYAWSERFSTTTSYTIEGIQYEDDDVSTFEDRLSHIVAQQFAFALSRRTSLVGEYRFRVTNYAEASNDYTSHYVLAGIDQAWSERTTGSLRAGAEFYESDRVSEVAPYFEAALDHSVTRKTEAHLYGAIGFDGSELGDYNSRYSYRSGLTASHKVSERFSVNAGAHYVYSDYEGDGETTEDVNEHQIHASAGLAYRLWHNVSMDAQYSYTLLTSDDEFRDYNRNRISLGLSAQF